MQIYLPIAEMSLNVLVLLGLGLGVGFVSGMFGVGGGFLMTPLLIFIGIPPAVAVSTEASQITASSVSGALAYRRRGGVDYKMGAYLLAGGVIGTVGGVQLFALLTRTGQIDSVISISYVIFLSAIGGLMLFESVRSLLRSRSKSPPPPHGKRKRTIAQKLPLRTRFPRSRLYISIIPPIAVGSIVGVLAAMLGIGGGFFMVPAMIYLLRMPTSVVVGTSLFQIIFVTMLVTLLQSVQNQTVDIFLAAILIIGGVLGAQIGVRTATKVRSEELRLLLALLVVGVGLKLAYDLFAAPAELFTLMPGGVLH